jgi:transposase
MKNSEIITLSKAELDQILAQKDLEIADLKHRLNELLRLIYGSKSDKIKNTAPDPLQLNLFAEPELPVVDPVKEEITYTRNKSKSEENHPLRTAIPEHLAREIEVILPENLPANAEQISVKVTELLKYIPGRIVVRRIERPVFKSINSEGEVEIIEALLPSLPIEKGNADASLLAYLIVSKYFDHIPFHRLVKMLKRDNLSLAESTVNGWFAKVIDLLEPLYEALKKEILQKDYLMADETPIPVLSKNKPGSTHRGYHWVYYDPLGKSVLFEYQPSRGREGPDELLKNFEGYLQTDGYTAYNNLSNKDKIKQLACFAHARRKFTSAQDNDAVRSGKALAYIAGLYAIEQEIREQSLSVDEIKAVREQKAYPILQEMKAWMDEEAIKILPQSAIGRAFEYTLKLWPRLIRYLVDGRLYIDNNPVENTIRPVAVGRKNYLFAGSDDGARRAAIIYSLLGTCKARGVDPMAWLTDILNRIPDHKANRLLELLPESISMP